MAQLVVVKALSHITYCFYKEYFLTRFFLNNFIWLETNPFQRRSLTIWEKQIQNPLPEIIEPYVCPFRKRSITKISDYKDIGISFYIMKRMLLSTAIDRHINNFTALSVVGVLQYAFLPLAL